MDVDHGNAQISGNVLFRLRGDQPLFLLDRVQYRQKRGPFLLILTFELV